MKSIWLKKALIVSLFLMVFFPLISFAAIIRTDKVANINSEENINENVYLVGNEPKVLGTTNGDIVVVGNNIEVSGTTNGDVLSLGQDLIVKGTINGDVRVFGGSISIEEKIEGDLLVVGAEINLLKDAQIKGDVILIGAKVNIENNIKNHLRIISGNTFIKGKIDGTANITSEKINILDEAEINNSLSYFSPVQAEVSDNAKINGAINFNKIDSIRENGLVQHAVVSFLNFWMLFRFITTLLLTFILVYVFKIFSQKTTNNITKHFWKSILTGVATSFLIPAIIIICLISLILFPVSILLLMIYIGIFIISTSVASIALGALLKKVFLKKDNFEISFNTAAIGVVILTLLQFVPIFGDLTRFVFIISSFGAIWIYLYEKIRWGDQKNVLEKN